MSNESINPPAFPRPGFDQPAGLQDGMSLRDWFAGQALGTMDIHHIVEISIADGVSASGRLAEEAYNIADAMLAARQATDREDGK